jgi:hypothetical protein
MSGWIGRVTFHCGVNGCLVLLWMSFKIVGNCFSLTYFDPKGPELAVKKK